MFRRYGENGFLTTCSKYRCRTWAAIPDQYHALPSQTVETFLVDVWVPANAPSVRMKLDVQVSLGGSGRYIRWKCGFPTSWRRVREAGRQDATGDRIRQGCGLGPLRSYLCGKAEKGGKQFRCPAGDPAQRPGGPCHCGGLEKKKGREVVAKGLLRGLGMDRAAFCAAVN